MKKFTALFLTFVFSITLLRAEWWDEGKYDWSKAQKLDDGIVFGNFKKESPRLMRIWVMRIDLSGNYRRGSNCGRKRHRYGGSGYSECGTGTI